MKFKKNFLFTLVEIICVVTISLLLAGVIIGRIVKLPASVVLNNSANGIKDFMEDISRMAVLQKKELLVVYKDRMLQLKNKDIYATASDAYIYHFPEIVDVDFSSENVSYKFYTDGFVTGPNMVISAKGHNILLQYSKLTGILSSRELE